ncbi:MAG: bifunctional 4-hydroxy-2-oxoglutarate aldolase/2-dehydro-3-deoxy-phosphogluconate aldolase, partial [Alphaproteobacteria bacterium]
MANNITNTLLDAQELVPVVVLDNAKDAVPLSKAILAAGGNFIEITLRTAAAIDAIQAIKAANLSIIVGAGTVLTKEDVDKAIESKADFLVAPGFDEDVVKYAISKNQLIIPGTITPSEVQRAMALGLEILKFFPAEIAGGAAMLKAFGSVYPKAKFMPTGGINADNIHQYIALANVGCIGGSWVCTKEDINEGKFELITQKLQKANQLF